MNENNENNQHKFLKTVLSIIISFLMIFIVALFVRSISNSILPKDNKLALLVNDYLDMMSIMTEKIAVGMRIKRNSVSEYQVNLITQSISDYVGYSLYQASSVVKDYDPNAKYTDRDLEKYKTEYYKMTLENPYLRGLSVFTTDGKMRINLYLPQAKSWPLELQENLIKDIKDKGSLVLNATNENTFYIMEYIKNKYGELIVATRNDYSYVSDIATYYQVADKRLYVSDSRDLVYSVKESIGDNNLDKVSSVINKFAFYKRQPSFVVSDSLSVSLVGKEYPNYFELVVLAVTALLILMFQFILNGVLYFIKHILNLVNNKAYVYSLHKDKGTIKDTIMDESLVNSELPEATPQEDMPPIIQKLHYKIPEEYAISMQDNKDKRFSIKDKIINVITLIKSEIERSKANKTALDEEINALEEELSSLESMNNDNSEEIINKESTSISENNNDLDSIVDTDGIIEAHSSIEAIDSVENVDSSDNIVKKIENTEDEYKFDEGVSYYNYPTDDTIDYKNVVEDSIDDIKEEKVLVEDKNIIEEVKKEEVYNNDMPYYNTESLSDLEYIDNNKNDVVDTIIEEKEEVLSDYASINNDELIKTFDDNKVSDNNDYIDDLDNLKTDTYSTFKDDIFEKKIVKNDILSSYSKEENKTFKTSNISILDSYSSTSSNNNAQNRKVDTSNTEDVFAAFDKMLSSIISKAEEDAKKSIGNRSSDK